ncbi:iron uptake system protein EfeO [Streptococcus loxodontisalivarius]|uniref:Iron uptake system component EfeO n=1 Tax=Streptococcus loxodontisalivarius TaxID=1349415 RepID=A0ABS2PQK9_9STRE|nr:iron uptake system protein EfeO [Streptococcus loxodontisalivarius]MBM7641820.1 iron uptake system component EfeO [Streptococcus loxodontisalivarius]
MKKVKLYTLLATVALSAFALTACSSSNTSTSTSSSSTSTLSSSEQKQIDQITEDYRSYVEGQIDQLLTDTESWATLLKEGKLDEAKAQYPLIRMAYERSEPIAESFGELDIKIDYRLVDYVDENNTEEGWTGFHRIERILWEQNTTSGTEEYATQLVNDIKELRAKVSTVDVTADMMATGAVDLLNEVATSKITGEEEVYSHTDLYDFRANIEGAEEIFELFKPILEEKDADLVETLTADFKTVNDLLDKYMTDETHYKSYTELTDADTKALSQAVTKLGEPLSQMGIVLE